jgi:2-polyprenyl-3-methyl-5-hydroxy-6-metoxy-1,4-benzoquinol methylase
MSSRKEIVALIQNGKDAAINILDVGCSCGGTLAALNNQYPKASLYGIELNQNAAKIAGLFANVQSCNCENEDLGYKDGFFDYIICADVLEHLRDPWNMLKRFHDMLKPDGFLLASIPNVMHHSVIRDLINGKWTYTDAGLLDRTHLRFFTPSTILDMFVKAGFADVSMSSVITVMSEEEKEYINKLCLLTDDTMRPNYEAYQIIVNAAATKNVPSSTNPA